ncbi:MAG: hypothetical protein ACO2ZJ_05715, partial [Pseudohongiellaceae bacterium]
MNLLKKTAAVVFFSGLVGSAAYGQEMTAVETAELGVQTLLQTVVESKDFFLSDRERYFTAIETVL